MTTRLITGLALFAGICFVSVLMACLVAGTAHFRLGWDVARSNAVGETVASLTFLGGLLAVLVRR